MKVWFTSDLHIGHVNLVEKWRLGPGFDGTVATHTDVIRERWNARVAPGDVVWVIGDAAMGHRAETVPLFDTFNGTKHLIIGNHDDMRKRELYEQHFTLHDGIVPGRTVSPYTDFLSGVIFAHYPWHGAVDHAAESRDYLEALHPKREDFAPGTVLIHGHTHDRGIVGDHSVHVGVDGSPDGPISFEQLISYIKQAKGEA
jgi:calcineurin-like phosphoesterase family protein